MMQDVDNQQDSITDIKKIVSWASGKRCPIPCQDVIF